MKKAALLFMAILFLGGLWFGQKAVAGQVTCPKCNVAVDTGTKPVIGMLEGREHKCPACGKSYTVAAEKNVYGCPKCGGLVYQCPACGKTESAPKA